MRICAIELPELRVEVLRATASDVPDHVPLGIVVAPAPLTESKLLGNMRLDVVSHEARSLGVRPGQTIAQARARVPDLLVRVVRPEAVKGELARIAEVALAFGATVAFDVASPGALASAFERASASNAFGMSDVVWVDVTGCAHLHGPDQQSGETMLATRLEGVIADLGHVCSIAIADGPRIAAILARSLPMDDVRCPVVVIPPGKNAGAMSGLGIDALPLPDEDVRWLVKIGVRTVAELSLLPRSALATRLGPRAPVILSLIEGDDRAPLAPYVPPEIPEEEVTLEYGIEGTEALVFVAKTLTDRLASRLAGRAVATSRIDLVLGLDAAMLREAEGDSGERDSGDREQVVSLELPAPLSSASDLLAALRPKLERLVLRAPVLTAKLRAPALVRKPQSALSLFEATPKAARALPRLVAELAADLGPQAVGKLALGDSWLPEERSRFVRMGDPTVKSSQPAQRKRRHLLSSIPEPTRVLPEPLPVPRDSVKIVRRLTRLESVEWWRHVPGERVPSVDFVYAWVLESPAWVEIDRSSGATRVRGWFD
ncbi:DNA polymerase IV-like protein ImuB [Labilithrix luteola]|uniref:DNA polymerase IV-like protein ImuB n=1 Tax=Labilithrix luteola TaxID=1391654 RepID=A0A0K1QA74_9BACT|nr:DNA polymerase Y family protein [Labilithrix luteola]AKV02572.1 DNA polymerase IV-like protein ImuB [Labilithrix luteola]